MEASRVGGIPAGLEEFGGRDGNDTRARAQLFPFWGPQRLADSLPPAGADKCLLNESVLCPLKIKGMWLRGKVGLYQGWRATEPPAAHQVQFN